MRVPQMIAAELRRLVSTPMRALALFALLCVPILYGGLYLWANQDPYGNLAHIPVALVVEDTGATMNGERRDFGDEIAKELLDSNTFDWHEVDADAAERGLSAGRYDFAVEVPSDFSAAIASISSDSPRKAEIVLRTNDANNYLASTIGNDAVAEIRRTVAQKVASEAGLTVLEALQTIRVKLAEAANGAQELVNGLETAHAGSAAAASGAAELAAGTVQLRDGASRLSNGAAQVAQGVDEIDGVAREVGAVSADAVALLPQARADIAALLADAGLDPDQIAAVLARLDVVGQRIEQLNDRGQATVALVDELAAGADEVAAGSSQLAGGTASAAEGAARLAEGNAQLDAGLGELVAGAQELQSGLADGVQQIPESDAATRQAQANTLADPVAIDTDDLAKAQNYGAGLAPFFAALAAWIGIYALFLIVKPVSRRAVTALHAPIRVTIAGWLTPALLGAVQMLGLFAVLALALRFSFANPAATLGILVLASAAYTTIILALNVWLGEVGQFLGLVLMVLQLVTAGGTFPWQTLPPPLAALHQVLPMGFVVNAMRQLMYGGDIGRVWLDIGVLAIWAVAASLITAIGVTRMTRYRTLRDLEPSIIS